MQTINQSCAVLLWKASLPSEKRSTAFSGSSHSLCADALNLLVQVAKEKAEKEEAEAEAPDPAVSSISALWQLDMHSQH